MTRIIFRDFDEFADAINGVNGRFIPTTRSLSDWWVQVESIGRLPIQQLQAGCGTTFAGDGADRALTVGIPTSISQQIRVDGEGLESNSLILIKQRQPFMVSSRLPTRWAGITLPLDHPSLDPALLQCLITQADQRGGPHVQATLPEVVATRALITRLLSASDSVELVNAAAIRFAEDDIMTTVSRLLESCSRYQGVSKQRRPRFPRERVVAKALAFIEEHEGQPLFMSDLCAATDVRERTLRNIFSEYFGIGPMRLLKVRQLREIRAALTSAEHGEQKIASIAARFGVWDHSAFARHYKALFDETPSMTLRTPPSTRKQAGLLSESWIRYASRKFSGSASENAPRM